MTPQILLTLAIFLIAALLFVTEKVRMDVVALLVLLALTLTGLVTPTEALSGFSSPAVVTIWAVFILSEGMGRTGLAATVGRQIFRLSGQGERQLRLVIMLAAGILSAFMNNVGVAALLLPVVLTLTRQASLPPSKLLMPLAIGALAGGMATLIGTPPNILAAEALREAGFEPFRLFDFTPVGGIILLSSITFMMLFGYRLLPERHPIQTLSAPGHESVDPRQAYALEERLTLIEIPAHSPLAGKTMAESRIGRALGVTILGLQRHGRKKMSVQPDTILQAGDKLLALGRLDRLAEMGRAPYFVIEQSEVQPEQLFSPQMGLAELKITPTSPFIGQTIVQVGMRRRFNFNVLALRRQGEVTFSHLSERPLQAGDTLLLYGDHAVLTAARLVPDFHGGLNIFVEDADIAGAYRLPERLLLVRIPSKSALIGQTLAGSHLGELFGLVALGVVRDGHTITSPPSELTLSVDDILLVEGNPEELAVVRGLQGLIAKQALQMDQIVLESAQVGLVEVVLSPHTTLANKTLRETQFREKYGLSVLAIWRNGRVHRTDLADMTLQFGDSFLLYGPREKIGLLAREPDFLVLTEEILEAPRSNKAPLAALIMVGMVVAVVSGWLPLAIAAIAAATLMVLTGCLHMDEAYQAIDWRAVFLIACMLPLGIAVAQSGTAHYLATGMVNLTSSQGPTALLAGFFALTALASQFLPNAVVIVFLAPIALNTAVSLNLSPHALLMVVAIAASASFMSPVAHPANALIMGPGGYRFNDYLKVGIPLALLVMLVTLVVLPLFWPL